ncbi:hypothetical protein [Sphingobacterium sp. SYP-B4668]|uniref:hypothetical protein n=1 Tax=Sphingobacterium sp. SYP-B4668 TaxID=2996035 RepID=UPI0022DDFDC5|nr:hypothetical protein [Sphingobacterium sp. SYP-B4668]
MKDSLYSFIMAVEQSPVVLPGLACDRMEGYCYCHTLLSLKEELIVKIGELMLTEPDTQFVQQKVRVLQLSLTVLANKLYQRQGKPDTSRLNTFLAIEEVLHHLRLTSGETIQHMGMPLFALHAEGHTLLVHYQKYQRKLKKNDVPPLLLDSLNQFFKQFAFPHQHAISYHQLEYAHKVLRGIENLILTEPANLWSTKIWKTLIYLNFNRERLMNHCRRHVDDLVTSGAPPLTIRTQLEEYLKELQQLDTQLGYAYQPSRTSLKDFIENLLLTEIDWQTKLPSLSSNLNQDAITVTLTAKQLSLLTDLNVQTRHIVELSTPQALRILLNHVRTVRGGTLSFETNRKKIKEMDNKTIEGTRLYLQALQDKLKELYPF